MSYAEFQIRAFAYNRLMLRELKLYRKQLYTQIIAPHQDVKKIPKSEQQFMPLFGESQVKQKIPDEVKKRYMEKLETYKRLQREGRISN
jgi:hypothetical protein